MTQFKDKTAKGGGGHGQRRAVHVPGAPGRRHPALRPHVRAGRRGPAAAPRVHARRRPALQPPLRGDPRGCRSLHPQGDRQDHRPAGSDGEMSNHGGVPSRHGARCSTTRVPRQEVPVRRHRLRLGGALRPRGEAGHQQPAAPSTSSLTGPRHRRPRGGVRRTRLRRPQEGPRRCGGRLRDSLPRPGRSRSSPTQTQTSAGPRTGGRKQAAPRGGRGRRCATWWQRVGFVAAAHSRPSGQ